MIAIEKLVCYSQVPRRGGHVIKRGHTGKHLRQPGGRGTRGNVERAFLVGSVGRNRQYRING